MATKDDLELRQNLMAEVYRVKQHLNLATSALLKMECWVHFDSPEQVEISELYERVHEVSEVAHGTWKAWMARMINVRAELEAEAKLAEMEEER